MDLMDERWEILTPIIPVPPRRADSRARPWREPWAVLHGTLWVLRTRVQWNDPPPQLRQRTVRPQVHHEALQAAGQWRETPEFTTQYVLREGADGSLSQGVRRFNLRWSQSIGLARTHVQQLFRATAMDVVRVIAWLWGQPIERFSVQSRTPPPGANHARAAAMCWRCCANR